MIIIGLAFLLAGAVLVLIGRTDGQPGAINTIGSLCMAVGFVLVVVGLILWFAGDVSRTETALMLYG